MKITEFDYITYNGYNGFTLESHQYEASAMCKPEPSKERSLESLKSEIHQEVQEHLDEIGLSDLEDSDQPSKKAIRKIQKEERRRTAQREEALLRDRGSELIEHFAEGEEICPADMEPTLHFIDQADSTAGHLFRLATLIWSIPVSRGIGRRMRFLIRDQHTGKLIGLLALGSPVFNLSARDEWIGWNAEDREARLVNVMDAYVLGAVPPYARLLGGKLVGALATSSQIQKRFRKRYGHRESVSGAVKEAELVLVTATSALGRSSLYNRLRLDGLFQYKRLGWTKGYGHFHIPEPTFQKMRELLEREDHKYAEGYDLGIKSHFLCKSALREVRLGSHRRLSFG